MQPVSLTNVGDKFSMQERSDEEDSVHISQKLNSEKRDSKHVESIEQDPKSTMRNIDKAGGTISFDLQSSDRKGHPQTDKKPPQKILESNFSPNQTLDHPANDSQDKLGQSKNNTQDFGDFVVSSSDMMSKDEDLRVDTLKSGGSQVNLDLTEEEKIQHMSTYPIGAKKKPMIPQLSYLKHLNKKSETQTVASGYEDIVPYSR